MLNKFGLIAEGADVGFGGDFGISGIQVRISLVLYCWGLCAGREVGFPHIGSKVLRSVESVSLYIKIIMYQVYYIYQ